MEWPIAFPELVSGPVSVRPYEPSDALELIDPLADESVWTYMSRPAPRDPQALNELITARLAVDCRTTFTVRDSGRAVGITSVLFDPAEPEGVEIGGTLLDPQVWGTGVNTAVKRMLLAAIFAAGAQWVQLQTDERNKRSAAAIGRLGAVRLGVREEQVLRQDGTLRRSAVFRIARPEQTK